MKNLFLGAALASAVLLAAGCTFTTAPTGGKGRVVLSAGSSGSSRALSAAQQLRAGQRPDFQSIRTAGRDGSGARSLSASSDIAAMGWRVENLNPWSGEETLAGDIDPSYPFLELFLTPGETYRISVDVEPTATAPGHATGVTRWGDHVDLTVPYDGETAYANLWVRPTGHWIVHPHYPEYGLRSDDGSQVYPTGLFASAPSPDPRDKAFYGPDGSLYYFSKAENGIYHWDDANPPGTVTKNAATPDYDGDGPDLIEIYAAAADPLIPGWVWLLVRNTTALQVWVVDFSDGPAVAAYYLDLQDFVEYPAAPTGTGLAVDNDWNLYVTYSGHDTTAAEGGVLQVDLDGFTLQAYPPDRQSGDSYFTDVAVQGGRLVVLSSPVFNGADQTNSFGGVVAAGKNQGWASVTLLDGAFNVTGGWEAYHADLASTPADGDFWAPARILGFQGPQVLFLSQAAWAAPFVFNNYTTRSTNALDLDTGAVTLDLAPVVPQ